MNAVVKGEESVVARLKARFAPGLVDALLPWLVAATLYLVVLVVGGNLLNDPDSLWHISVAEWILANGLPTADPFSFTFTGSPWISKEWLSQFLLLGAYKLAGWPGVGALSAAALAAAFGILVRFLRQRLTPMAVISFVAVAFVLVSPHAVARPHLLALPIMVAFVAGLVTAADDGKAPSFWLLPLMVIWANLHAGFTIGILMVAAVGLDAIVSAKAADRGRLAAKWVPFAVLAVVAGCFTPYGPESFIVTWRVLSLGPALQIISEWRPPDFSTVGGLEIALLGAIGFVLYRGFTLPPVRIVIVLGLLHLALAAGRNGEILGLLAPLFIAAPLARQVPAVAADGRLRSAPLAAALLLAALVPLTAALALINDYRPNPRVSPAAAVEAIVAANPGPVLNDYEFGGYLISAGVPSFIDGRTELYGGDFVARHYRAVTLADLKDFLTLLEEYRIGATLLTPQTPAVGLLDTLPGWRRLYADDVAIVHVRSTP